MASSPPSLQIPNQMSIAAKISTGIRHKNTLHKIFSNCSIIHKTKNIKLLELFKLNMYLIPNKWNTSVHITVEDHGTIGLTAHKK